MTGPTPADARAQRLAAALRANLRRRKTSPAERDDAGADGAPGGEALYPARPGAPADDGRN